MTIPNNLPPHVQKLLEQAMDERMSREEYKLMKTLFEDKDLPERLKLLTDIMMDAVLNFGSILYEEDNIPTNDMYAFLCALPAKTIGGRLNEEGYEKLADEFTSYMNAYD